MLDVAICKKKSVYSLYNEIYQSRHRILTNVRSHRRFCTKISLGQFTKSISSFVYIHIFIVYIPGSFNSRNVMQMQISCENNFLLKRNTLFEIPQSSYVSEIFLSLVRRVSSKTFFLDAHNIFLSRNFFFVTY